MLVADGFADGFTEFFGDAVGYGDSGDASWLGAGDLFAVCAESELEGNFGELGCFAGAGIAADDYDLMGAQGGEDGGAMGYNREFGVRSSEFGGACKFGVRSSEFGGACKFGVRSSEFGGVFLHSWGVPGN